MHNLPTLVILLWYRIYMFLMANNEKNNLAIMSHWFLVKKVETVLQRLAEKVVE